MVCPIPTTTPSPKPRLSLVLVFANIRLVILILIVNNSNYGEFNRAAIKDSPASSNIYAAINNNPNNFVENANLKELTEYLSDNGVTDSKCLEEIADNGFASLIEVRGFVLGEDYKKTIPFLLRLHKGLHDPYFLLQYYAAKLDCAQEELVAPAVPDPSKDLLTSKNLKAFVDLLQPVTAILAPSDRRQQLIDQLDALIPDAKPKIASADPDFKVL